MILGLTGGICTGKSTATQTLRAEGVRVVDCDEVSHYLSNYSPRVLQEIRNRFGSGFFRAHGALDRPALAQAVFSDMTLRADLEHILHPPIWEVVDQNIDYAKQLGQSLVVVVPLLYESGRIERFDRIWVIASSRENQLARLMQRSGLTREQAELRIDAQLSTAEKARRADLAIANDGTMEEFRVEILRQWHGLADNDE